MRGVDPRRLVSAGGRHTREGDYDNLVDLGEKMGAAPSSWSNEPAAFLAPQRSMKRERILARAGVFFASGFQVLKKTAHPSRRANGAQVEMIEHFTFV